MGIILAIVRSMTILMILFVTSPVIAAPTYSVPKVEYKRDPFIPELLPTSVYVLREGSWFRVDLAAGGSFHGAFLVSPTVIIGYWLEGPGLKTYYAIKVID